MHHNNLSDSFRISESFIELEVNLTPSLVVNGVSSSSWGDARVHGFLPGVAGLVPSRSIRAASTHPKVVPLLRS
jgi:hypothetical protein